MCYWVKTITKIENNKSYNATDDYDYISNTKIIGTSTAS